MGFPCIFLKVPKCFTFNFFSNLVSYIGYLFTTSISHLGLLKPPEESHVADEPAGYILITDGLCPSPVPVPVHVLTALIKKKLPVVKYSNFLEEKKDCDEQETICLVCLDCVEGRDEIRELCNCCHVFHRECLDKWVDMDQVTCPTCRTMLFPDNRRSGPSWWKERPSAVVSGGDSPAPPAGEITR